MSVSQPLFSVSKLMFKLFSRKKVALEHFSPFSIKIEQVYCSESTLEPFKKVFTDAKDIPTFAFIAGFRPALQCLVQAPIPSSLLGLIHLKCDIEIHQEHNWYLPYDIEVTLKDYTESDKGITYLITTDFYQMGIKTISNHNLMLDKSKDYKPKQRECTTKSEINCLTQPLASWPIGLKTTWSYAKISGDYNPIHLNSFLAKKLKLKSAIAHGMFNAHECLKQLNKKTDQKLRYVGIEFNKPCFIPSQVFLRQYNDSNKYGVFSSNKKDRYLKVNVEYFE